jgi:hypothetical protein
MMRRHAIAAVFILAGVIVAPAAFGQQRAADGVTINDEGLPQYSTF